MQLAGVRRQFVKAAMNARFLERDEERALAVSWKNDRDEVALHELAAAHMRLVIALAATGVFSTIGFVLVERRAREPILPMSLFTNRNFALGCLF